MKDGKKIEYLPDGLEMKEKMLWWQKRGLSQTSTGYGSKLTSTKMVRYNDRWYRVYVMCYSNNGSAYIITKGNMLFLR
jgi:hypothetical protein